jgi:predicted nucleic acid-binding protein
MVDTNIIIDYLADQAPFADQAERIISLCEHKDVEGYLTASAVTDIYYIMRKIIGHEKTMDSLKLLFSVFEVADVGKSDLIRAMNIGMRDYEDALVAVCAKRVKAECVVTRNIGDFKLSPVPSMLPEAFISRYFPLANGAENPPNQIKT